MEDSADVTACLVCTMHSFMRKKTICLFAVAPTLTAGFQFRELVLFW